MPSDTALRDDVVWLLEGGNAHVKFRNAVARMPRALEGKGPRGLPYSPWQQLEHMRICQEDILKYIQDPNYESPEWPEGYWPAAEPPGPASWRKSVSAFETDRRALVGLARTLDLLAPVPADPDGPTLLHELLLVADHNAYHLGQLIVLRRLLGAWQE